MKASVKKAFVSLNDTKKPKVIDWAIAAAIILLCYVSFNHDDLITTANHGKNLVECILTGKFLEFYDYTHSTAVYSITLYIVFAVWSLPVMLIHKIFGIGYAAIPFPELMWYKLLPTLFYIGTAVLIYKIMLELEMKENIAKWGFFLFISSPVAMFSQFIFGQYDSIGIFFTVLALYMFLRKKYYAFAIWASVAVTFKMFALFLFVPLVVLIEKRFVHIIKFFLIGISGYLVTPLLFMRSEGYRQTLKFGSDISGRLFGVGISTSMGVISVYITGMIVICIFAYMTRIKDDTDFYTKTIYISFAVFALLFVFITVWHPQWMIWLVPFMTLAMLLNANSNASLILQTVMSVGYLGTTIGAFAGNVDSNMLVRGIFQKLYSSHHVASLNVKYSLIDRNLFYGLFAGSILALALIYFFTVKNPDSEKNTIKTKEYKMGDRIFILSRTLSILMFVLPSFYYLFFGV